MLALAQVVRNRLRVFGTALLVSLLLAGCQHKQQLSTVSLRELLAMDKNPAMRGQRVVVNGIVTYSDPEWHLLFVQDEQEGIYIAPPPNSDFRAGDRLQITGTTTEPSKLLDKPEFAVAVHGPTPDPIQLKNASEFPKYPSKLVETTATVRWAGIRNGRATLEGYAGDTRFQALIFPGTSEDLPRIGSEITISGVSTAIYDSQGQVQTVQLLTPSARSLHTVKPGPEHLFAIPATTMGDLHKTPVGSLVHLSGRVMDRVSSLALLDGTHSVTVNLRRPLHGDFASAEVVGFWTGSSIDDAMIRPTGELLAHHGDIRTLGELKHLTAAEASAARHISIRAVVTYYDPYWGLLFLQDHTAASFVNPRGLNVALHAGDMVDVSGVSGPGDYAPIIAEPAISFVGRGPLPEPLHLDLIEGNLAAADSQWCQFRGIVHSVNVVDGHTNLKLGAGDTALNVQLPTLIKGEQLLDKEILVRGALGILFNDRHQLVGHQIFVPGPQFLTIVGSGGSPNSESPIVALRRYSPTVDERHSVALIGTVVLIADANTIFVQDQTAGIQVRGVGALNVDTGDHVKVRGFLRPGDYSPALEDAVVTVTGRGSLPEPEYVSAKHAADGPYDSEFVALRGILTDMRSSPSGVMLVVNDGGTYFDAIAPSEKDVIPMRLGSQIEVRGICQVTLDRTHVPYSISGFTLAFDSPQSITVLKPGPWWDQERIRWALLLFGVFFIAVVLWATMLRREVLSRTLELQLSLTAKRKAQQFDRARNEVLESIARNAPLPESMERLALAIEEQIPEAVCAILMPTDGKSFLNGKPAPVFVAPGLTEEAQQAPAFSALLHGAFRAGDPEVLSSPNSLVDDMLHALSDSGLGFVSGHSLPVLAAAGTGVGMVILLSNRQLSLPPDSVQHNVLQSAARLISLARDHWQMHERLLHEARHDGLTGLPNRMVAEDRLEQALARAERRRKSFAVFCIDLDGFKAVNDELGHDAGDELLKSVAAKFRSRIRHSDTLARIGGDEFLAIIEDCSSDAAAQAVADSLISSLYGTQSAEGARLTLSASVGIAMFPADGKNASQLRRNADQAMYRAKNSGGGQACFCSRKAEPASQAARNANFS